MQQLPSLVTTVLGLKPSKDHVHLIITAQEDDDKGKGKEEEHDSVAELKPVAHYYRRAYIEPAG